MEVAEGGEPLDVAGPLHQRARALDKARFNTARRTAVTSGLCPSSMSR
ncbi:hypothetical protein M8C17_01300 [Micromonospora sp. RHAY321]|nr:hypothetical protein [Micromonospora sp. RHAY321]MCO1593796.1 hypothetical protein [Micromonospora sp. RHAY321]